ARVVAYLAPSGRELAEVVANMPIRSWTLRIGRTKLIAGLGPIGVPRGHRKRIAVRRIRQPNLFEVGLGSQHLAPARSEVAPAVITWTPGMRRCTFRRLRVGARPPQAPPILDGPRRR